MGTLTQLGHHPQRARGHLRHPQSGAFYVERSQKVRQGIREYEPGVRFTGGDVSRSIRHVATTALAVSAVEGVATVRVVHHITFGP